MDNVNNAQNTGKFQDFGRKKARPCTGEVTPKS